MSESLRRFFAEFNIVEQCKKYRVSIFACPPFLFIVIGLLIIIAMIGTTFLARQYSDDPAIVIIAVSIMTAFLFVIGHAVVMSFERLADASRMKSEFVSIVSHQLRSPLSAIKWQLELVLDSIQKADSGKIESTLASLREQNERMIALVNDLLEVNRIDDDRLLLRPTLVQLDAVIEELVLRYQPIAQKAQLKLFFEAKERPLWVFLDDSKLRWVAENLLENAVRYTLEGGEVHVRIFKDRSIARVEVGDNGVGIPLRDQDKIFTKFFRSENALRLRTQGSGLGLFLVRALAEAMGGKVGFASLEGKGSTFWFSFALIQKDSEEISLKKHYSL